MKSLISPSLSFLKTVSYEGPNIYDIHTERRWGGLKICSYLWILLFLCSFLRMKSGCGGKKLVIFCGRKISLLSICTFRMKSNLAFLIFKNGTKTHKQILPWMKKLKTCQERPHLLCSVEWSQEWLSYRGLTVAVYIIHKNDKVRKRSSSYFYYFQARLFCLDHSTLFHRVHYFLAQYWSC